MIHPDRLRKATAHPPEMLTSKTARKVKGAAAGGALGPAAGAAVCELIQALGLELDTAVCLAIATLLSAGLGWLVGYRTRPAPRDQLK